MGIERQSVSTKMELENQQYVEALCRSCWPNLTRSSAVNLIVTEHRILTELGIFDRIRGSKPTEADILNRLETRILEHVKRRSRMKRRQRRGAL